MRPHHAWRSVVCVPVACAASHMELKPLAVAFTSLDAVSQVFGLKYRDEVTVLVPPSKCDACDVELLLQALH